MLLERILPLTPGNRRVLHHARWQDPDDVCARVAMMVLKQVALRARYDSLWDALASQRSTTTRIPSSFLAGNPRPIRLINNNQVRSAYGDEIESRIAAMRSAGRQQGGVRPSGFGLSTTGWDDQPASRC